MAASTNVRWLSVRRDLADIRAQLHAVAETLRAAPGGWRLQLMVGGAAATLRAALRLRRVRR